MELDLSGIDLFDADKITFDKRKTYIYGPNGTGKTTISNQIKKMSNDYDVYVFQGFESVISSDKTLNAIVLGTENVEISRQLDEIDGLIRYLEELFGKDKMPECKAYLLRLKKTI